MTFMSRRVAVVGAGIAGLVCAFALKRAGFDVVVFEAEAQVGGRMSSRTKDGFVFDLGADHLCDLYDGIKRYAAEFAIPWERMRFLKYGVFRRGRILGIQEAIGRVSKWRLALTYLLARDVGDFFDLSHLAAHDHDNAYDFMRWRAGSEVSDYFVDAFASTYQFHRAREISLAALFGIMRSIQKDKPRWDLHRTRGGMQALPNAFASRLDVRTSTPVTRVTADRGVQVETPRGAERFDLAVLACQAPIGLAIYQNPTGKQRQVLEETRYAATISVAFRVPREKLPDIAVVWVPYVESQKISGYVNEAMKGEETVRDGKSLICTWLHEEFARSVMDLSEPEIFSRVNAELARVCPWVSEDELEPFDMQKWPLAMPKFAHGHLSLVKRFLKDGQGEQNVYLCGDYLNSPWTEGALRCGERVARQIIDRASKAL
jgi:oxygen-dependent protoporphyrinogen oxidase